MSIIIRLQNLPWEANSLDIRRFFQGLSIPDGGVHIVGGEKGDAFIAFASDEDARQAMARDGGAVKDARVKLLLSSRSEMQKVIEQARNQSLGLKSADGGAPQAGLTPVAGIQASQPPPIAQTGASLPPMASLGSLHNAGILATPLQGTGALGANLTETDIRRRTPDRGRRRSRSIERERLSRNRTRSRSRSPTYRNNQQLGRHIPLEDTRSGTGRVGIDPSHIMPAAGLSTNNNHSENMGHSYPNNGNGLPPVRMRLGGYVEPLPPVPYENSVIPPGMDRERRLPPQIHGNNDTSNSVGYANNATGGIGVTNMQPSRSFSIELRGLPYNVIPRDIQDFFRGTGVFPPEDSIKILVDANGYTTGGAVVRLASERELEVALSMNGRYLSDRRIEIMPLVDNMHSREPNPDLMRGAVPPNSNILAQIPQGLGVTAGAPISGCPPDTIGAARDSFSEPLPKRDYVVYMKGIPYNSCTDRDISNFFGPLRIVEIVLEMDPSGKPAGNAFVEFATREDYNGALEMNLKHMGRRYIEIFPTTREDLNEARRLAQRVFGDRTAHHHNQHNAPPQNQAHAGGDIRQTYCISVTGLPPTVTNRDLTSYFLDVGAQPYAIHIMLKPNGFNAGEAFIEFLNPDHHMKALRRDGDFVGSHRISVKSVAFELMRSIVQPNPNAGPPGGGGPPSLGGMASDLGRSVNSVSEISEGRGRERSRGLPPRGGHPLPSSRLPPPPEEYRRKDERSIDRSRDPFADPRCVVIASNIPYRATVDDICVFFADFGLTPDCVTRRFNDKGQPTPDARIAFRTPEDANRAVRQMHKKFLIERPVFLRHAV